MHNNLLAMSAPMSFPPLSCGGVHVAVNRCIRQATQRLLGVRGSLLPTTEEISKYPDMWNKIAQRASEIFDAQGFTLADKGSAFSKEEVQRRYEYELRPKLLSGETPPRKKDDCPSNLSMEIYQRMTGTGIPNIDDEDSLTTPERLFLQCTEDNRCGEGPFGRVILSIRAHLLEQTTGTSPRDSLTPSESRIWMLGRMYDDNRVQMSQAEVDANPCMDAVRLIAQRIYETRKDAMEFPFQDYSVKDIKYIGRLES